MCVGRTVYEFLYAVCVGTLYCVQYIRTYVCTLHICFVYCVVHTYVRMSCSDVYVFCFTH